MHQQSSRTSATVATDNSLSTQDMWEMYIQGIVSATGLPGSNLILTGTTVAATLATTSVAVTPVPTLPQALAQIYLYGDNLLVPTGFATQAGQSYFSDYATYINNLEPQNAHPTPSQQAAINLAQASLRTASGQYDTDITAANAAFIKESALLPGKWPTFQAFLNDTPWGGMLDTDQNAVNGANGRLNTLYIETYGQDYVAINQANTVVNQVRTDLTAAAPSTPAEMLITPAGNQVVPTYNPSSLATFSSWVDMAAAGPANQQAPEINITIRQGAGQYDISKSAYFSQTSWSENFFFFSISGTDTETRTQVDVDTSSSSFSVNLTFQAVTSVQIDPGPWFDSSLMFAYKNPSGLVIPTALIIGMMPTVTVTFDEASFQSAFSSFSSSHTFGVGIFGIAGGDGSSSSGSNFHSEWSSEHNSLTITDISTQPKIIGLQVSEPGATATPGS